MATVEAIVDRVAEESDFSGVVRVDRAGDVELAKAYGLAHRAYGIPNTVDTRMATASGMKGFTALTVVSLIDDGVLELSTPARHLLGSDLPLIDDAVTVEQLLAHRSGIGDYLDEDELPDINAYAMPVPVHQLADVEDFVVVLDGHPMKFPPGERFSYCNGGYVVLALLAERAAGVPFPDLVRQRVCQPAGLHDTEQLRSDELPDRTALGYVVMDGAVRSNVLHLPVRGTGDGGIYTTVADMVAFWTALFEGRIVSPSWVAEMTRPRSEGQDPDNRYGLGFWLQASRPAVSIEGYDAGVSFRSVHDEAAGLTYTVIANTSEGAWPILRALDAHLYP